MTDRARALLHVLDAALDAAERGWFVFPIRPNRKAPAVFRDWEGRATRDRATLHRWFGGPIRFNIGIATGPSNLVVVDLDSAASAGKSVPLEGALDGGRQALARLAGDAGQVVPADTFSVRTPHGLHLYFVAPSEIEVRNSASRLAPQVDVRAVGGYVLAPASVVAGRRYRVSCPLPPVPLPSWLLSRLRAPGVDSAVPPPAPGASRRVAYVEAALQGEARNVAAAALGTRNQTLFVAAARLGGFVAAGVLAEATARATLIGACAGHIGVNGFDHAEAQRTVDSGLRHGARRPRALPTPRSGQQPPRPGKPSTLE